MWPGILTPTQSDPPAYNPADDPAWVASQQITQHLVDTQNQMQYNTFWNDRDGGARRPPASPRDRACALFIFFVLFAILLSYFVVAVLPNFRNGSGARPPWAA